MRKAIIIVTFFYSLHVNAQTEKISIAILPFVDAVNGSNSANLIQEMVTKEFVKTGRFDIVDRSKFQRVMDELKVQKSEEFLNSKIVNQGKQLGAEFLITGVITEMNSQSELIQSYSTTQVRTPTTVWKHNIKFSYQVINVETGKAVYSENIGAINSGTHNTNKSDAMDNAQCLLRKQIRSAVMKQFPEEIQIVKIEKTTKKGLPDEVLINAGTSYFDADSKNECDKGLLDKGLRIFKKESVKLKAFEIELLTVNGKESKREIEIGILKVKDVQGDFSVCEVTDGAKEIQSRMNSNQKILLRIL